MKTLALLVATTIATLTTQAQAEYHGSDYESAYKASIDSGETLVVLISATWCSPCNQLKKDIKAMVLAGLLPEGVNIVTLDYKSETAKAMKPSGSVPELIKYERRKGKWVRTSSIGYLPPRAFKEFCNGKK